MILPSIVLVHSAGQTTPATTQPGVVTIQGGPNATAPIPGPRNDPGDFFGIALALAGALLAVGLARLIFGRFTRPKGRSG